MKKNYLFLFFLLFFILPVNIFAKTMGDLYQELYYLKEIRDNYHNLSIDDRQSLKTKESEILTQISIKEASLINLKAKINKYENEISILREKINKILLFYQITNKKNIYLEYILDANNYKELIYRSTSSKRIIEYNYNIILSYQSKLEELEESKEKINKELKNLEQLQQKYLQLLLILKNSNITKIDSIETNLDGDIYNLEKEINAYQSLGCLNDMDLSLCFNIKKIASFKYPLEKGCVTKEYDITSHKGIDLGCNKEEENVYASGDGIVSEIIEKSSCGGNIVFIYHNVNGNRYTTIYGHLLDIKVSLGQVVDANTVIGLLGGESTAFINGGYDKCTNGAHLHYTISNDYHTYDFSVYTKDPRWFNQYPDLYKGFFQR